MYSQRLALAAALACLPLTAQAADAPVSVMIVGVFHMANPEKDLHNVRSDDMLAPKRQAQIKAAVDGIARFHPTMVDVEGDGLYTEQQYTSYRNRTLPPSHNERVQLGYRLGKRLEVPVYGIDWMGDFPYQNVLDFAKSYGGKDILDKANADVETSVKRQNAVLRTGTVSAALRHLNDPKSIASDNAFYRRMLLIGYGNMQPGADLLTAWYKRNFYICANLAQLAKPGDRVVVFYGAGHAFLLRQCVSEMPGYKLVEPNDYLPR